MTAVKKKNAEDRVKGAFFETFYVQETSDALVITEPPNPFIGALVTFIFGLPMLIVSGVLVVFAVREGGGRRSSRRSCSSRSCCSWSPRWCCTASTRAR